MKSAGASLLFCFLANRKIRSDVSQSLWCEAASVWNHGENTGHRGALTQPDGCFAPLCVDLIPGPPVERERFCTSAAHQRSSVVFRWAKHSNRFSSSAKSGSRCIFMVPVVAHCDEELVLLKLTEHWVEVTSSTLPHTHFIQMSRAEA